MTLSLLDDPESKFVHITNIQNTNVCVLVLVRPHPTVCVQHGGSYAAYTYLRAVPYVRT